MRTSHTMRGEEYEGDDSLVHIASSSPRLQITQIVITKAKEEGKNSNDVLYDQCSRNGRGFNPFVLYVQYLQGLNAGLLPQNGESLLQCELRSDQAR